MKRLAFFLLLLIESSFILMNANDEIIHIDGISYSINDIQHEAVVTKGCHAQNVTIPAKINVEEKGTYVVIGIGEFAFYGCKELHSITFGSDLLYIDDSAFDGCSNLQEISLPESIQFIGQTAFAECSSITQVTIPQNLQQIGSGTFAGCTSLTHVQWNAIQCNVMPFVNASRGISEVDHMFIPPFFECKKLKNVAFANTVEVIPDYFLGFCKCKVKNLLLPSSLIEIGEYAFAELPIKEILIPGSVSKIGDYAFVNCTKLKNVVFHSILGLHISTSNWFEGCRALRSTQCYLQGGKYVFGDPEAEIPTPLKQ